MTGCEPLPLKAGGEAAPELVRALYALSRRNPGAARLARVAHMLAGGPLDAPLERSRKPPRLLPIAVGFATLGWLTAWGYREMDQDLRAIWAKRIERWRQSGLTAKEFAAELDVRPNSLSYWKSKLREPEPAASRVQPAAEREPSSEPAR
ncbi:MAG TPA: hypothetical protein VJV78_03895 [Polyangiales bacterium]|nr:hypothetical protein [Polyangiales bacterium]